MTRNDTTPVGSVVSPDRRVNPNLGNNNPSLPLSPPQDSMFPDDDVFGADSGYSRSERESYQTLYELMKDYPEWLALLKANPYAGFNVPQSFFDQLGLSNKAKDKLNAYRQSYKEYNAELLLKFQAWKNSLPETQRQQVTAAGYNADAIDVQPSSIAPEGIQTTDPSQIESDSSALQLMQVLTSCLGTMNSLVAAGTTMSMTRANVNHLDFANDKIAADTTAQKLKNYQMAYEIAKGIYGETADVVTSEEGDDITPSTKFDLKNAPPEVVELLNQFQHSRGFKAKQNQSIKEVTESDTGVMTSDMEKTQTEVLYGKKETWQDLRALHSEVTRLQLDNIQSYLEMYDPLLSAEVSNKYNAYMKSFYSVLDGEAAGQSQNEYVSNLRKSLEANKKAIECKKKMIEIRSQMIDTLFQYATDGNFLQRNAAKGALMAADIASDYFGVAQPANTTNPNTISGTPSMLQVPSIPAL